MLTYAAIAHENIIIHPRFFSNLKDLIFIKVDFNINYGMLSHNSLGIVEQDYLQESKKKNK